jgi:hypothetical protein
MTSKSNDTSKPQYDAHVRARASEMERLAREAELDQKPQYDAHVRARQVELERIAKEEEIEDARQTETYQNSFTD